MQSRVTEHKIMIIVILLYHCKHTGDLESTEIF